MTTPKKTFISTSETADKYFLGAPDFDCTHFSNYIRDYHCVYLSEAKFASIQRDYLEDGGDPKHVDPKIARKYGWELRWVRSDITWVQSEIARARVRSDTVPETREQVA